MIVRDVPYKHRDQHAHALTIGVTVSCIETLISHGMVVATFEMFHINPFFSHGIVVATFNVQYI
jgi:hypothetical protein